MRDLDSTEIIDDVFTDFDITAAGNLARKIRMACEELNLVVPKWHLRCWTRAELGEKTGIEEGTFELEEPWYWNIDSGFYYNKDDEEDEVEDDGYESGEPKYDLLISLKVNQQYAREAHEQYRFDLEDEGKECTDDLYSDVNCKAFIEENEGYLDQFEKDLTESGLKERTIEDHLFNTRYFLNSYVAGYERLPMHRKTVLPWFLQT